MALEDIWEGDSLSIDVDVKNEDGSVVDISAAEIKAGAASGGAFVAADTITVTDGPGGLFTMFFNAGRLTTKTWDVQARVIDGAAVDTVYASELKVRKSIFSA